MKLRFKNAEIGNTLLIGDDIMVIVYPENVLVMCVYIHRKREWKQGNVFTL